MFCWSWTALPRALITQTDSFMLHSQRASSRVQVFVRDTNAISASSPDIAMPTIILLKLAIVVECGLMKWGLQQINSQFGIAVCGGAMHAGVPVPEYAGLVS